MSWSYDVTDLDSTTDAGRLNIVRFLISDTDTTDQLVQDEEITFALTDENDNVYKAAAVVAGSIYAKYARLVNTEIDEALRADYSDLAKNYKKVMDSLEQKARTKGNPGFKIIATGITKTDINNARNDTDRVHPQVRSDRFLIKEPDYVLEQQ